MSVLWSYLLIAGCLIFRLWAQTSDDGGRAQCERPTIHNIYRISRDKEYYDKGESVTVRCISGYYPSSNTMTCDNPRTLQEWSPPTVTCTAQCGRPTIENMERLTGDKQYYYKGESVTVRCISGYYPSSNTMTCDNPRTSLEWSPPTVTCIALCRNPDGTTLTMTPEKEFYDIGDKVTVTCQRGYRGSSPTVTCQRYRTTIEWNPYPRCIAQCERPTIHNMYRIYEDKEYYNKGESVKLQCISGYYQSSKTMRCDNPRTPLEWSPPTVTCTAQCGRPTIENMESLTGDKEYYNEGESVTVRCISGYYPSSKTMTCDNPRTLQEWSLPTVTCIGVTATDWRVTPTSISVQFCTPKCPDEWNIHVECCPVRINRPCKTLSGKSVTFTDLRPNSDYSISSNLLTNWGSYNLGDRYIRTGESAPGIPDITRVPSMEENTIRWRLPGTWGNITGFQMNISAWREYNVSFAEGKSIHFPPNVTEYKVPLQNGTNYTITLRGFTSAGAGGVTTHNIETDIGDPPPHMEKTMSDGRIQLHPVPDQNGPIRSYEIIVFGGQDGNLREECLGFENSPYNSSWTPTSYTTAVLPAMTLTQPRTFIIGDNQHYNGFHNAPLIPNHNYTVYIRVTSQWKHVERSSCALAGLIGDMNIEKNDKSSGIVLSYPSLGFIITWMSLKCVALVVLAVIALRLWMKSRDPAENRKKRQRENTSTEDDYENALQLT